MMTKKSQLILFLFLLQVSSYGQVIDDFGTWWGAEVRKTFFKDLKIGVRFETRLNENSTSIKNIYIAPSIKYSPLKWLNLGFNYRFDNRYQRADNYFTQRHRIAFDLGFLYTIKRFEFEFRNRTQLQWEDYYSSSIQYPLLFNRNQLAVTYKWPQLPFSSGISGELWLPLVSNTMFSKFRLVICQEYRLKEQHRFQLRFVFQTDLNTTEVYRDYILSTRYIYSF